LVWGVFEEGCFSGAPGLHVRQHQVGLWEKKTCDTVGWIRLAALYYVCKLSSCLRILKCGLLRGKRLTLDLGCFTSISQELVCLLLGFGYRRLYLHISDVDRMTSSAPKCNGGARRFSQAEWKPAVECNGIRELNCESDGSSRCESRS